MHESVHERVYAVGFGQPQRNLIAFYFDYPAGIPQFALNLHFWAREYLADTNRIIAK